MNNVVVYNQRLNDEYNILGFRSSSLSKQAKPGNFLMLNTNINNNVTDPLLKRAFAICDIKDDIIYILYKVVGKGTKNLTNYKNGDIILSSDVLGNSFNLSYNNKKIALIAGGIGIAPFIFLIKHINENNIIDLYYGGKSSNDICLVDKFKVLNELNNIIVSTEDGSYGNKGVITEFIEKEYDVAYICGPNKMIYNAIKRLNPSCVIEVSMETTMACGIGVCMGCIISYNDKGLIHKKCCKDGPIFDGRKILWEKIVC